MTVDVLVPTYKPGKRFLRLLKMLQCQTCPPQKILVINTEAKFWNEAAYEGFSNLQVSHITKEEFDHGAVRNKLAAQSQADVMVFMTDDAVPADEYLLEKLLLSLQDTSLAGGSIAMAYARQLPQKDCKLIEAYTRQFNYPEEALVKTKSDLPKLGIKTYFASNVCCAYRREVFEAMGGFLQSTIFNEDMIFAAGVIQAGYGIAYVPQARVIHSHNLTFRQQFHRNFDLAVSQAEHPEIFQGLPSEGEGIRMVKKTAAYLIHKGKIWLLPGLVMGSAMKYAGYFLGKRYKVLPKKLVLLCTMSPLYWEKKWRIQP